MKTLDVNKATGSLAKYVKELDQVPLLLTHKGRAVAALMPVDGLDCEALSLSSNPDFVALIEHSRERQSREGGISSAEARRLLSVEEKPAAKARIRKLNLPRRKS
jgi:hypothetical protein